MNKKPLVSVIIIAYKNYNYLYEAVDSVLSQDYSNIELIVSNDGSDDFKVDELNKYLKNNAKKNIKRTVAYNNETNLGTVKNSNKAIKLSTGEYIVLFAADDAISDSHVISRFIDAFAKLPKKELIVTSQIGMYDINLDKLIQPFVSKEDQKLVRESDPKQLFAEMSTRCILPGSGTCYKKIIFEKYGYFDERYKLVEDYSSALRFSRLGIKYNYVDFMSFKHRDGGVSHGNVNGERKINKNYELDIINICKYEVLPYIKILNARQRHDFLNIYNDRKWRYEYKFEFQDGSKTERRYFVIKNFKIITRGFFRDLLREIHDQLIGKKAKLFLLGFLLFTAYSINIDFQAGMIKVLLRMVSYDLNHLVGTTGLLLMTVSVVLVLYTFLKKFMFRIFNFVRFLL